MVRIPLLLLVAAIATGCSTKSNKPSPGLIPPPESKEARVSRDLTMSWETPQRGGAALRQHGYIDVLGPRSLHEQNGSADQAAVHSSEFVLASSTPNDGTIEPAAVANVISEIDQNKRRSLNVSDVPFQNGGNNLGGSAVDPHGYSIYEMSRWERFCDNGNGMDEDDWIFITKHDGHMNVPSILIDTCDIPAFSYKEYTAAWIEFCNDSSITPVQRNIVRNSVRPRSKVAQCDALQRKP